MPPHFPGLGIEKERGAWTVTEHISLIHIPVNSFRATWPLRRHSDRTFRSFPEGFSSDGLSNKCYGDREAFISPPQAPFCKIPCWSLHCPDSRKHTLPHQQTPTRQARCPGVNTAVPSTCHVPGSLSYPLQGSPLPWTFPLQATPACLHLLVGVFSLWVGPCSPHSRMG